MAPSCMYRINLIDADVGAALVTQSWSAKLDAVLLLLVVDVEKGSNHVSRVRR